MIVTGGVVAEIVSHAATGWPYEVCGVVAGSDGIGTHVFRLDNVSPDSLYHFSVDPESQLRAWRELDEMGLDPIAVYHSHTSGVRVPSRDDVDRHDQSLFLLLVCAHDVDEIEILAFHVSGGTVARSDLDVA